MDLLHARALVDGFSNCTSAAEVGRLFGDAIRPFGYPMTSCGVSNETPEGMTWLFYFNSWPDDWLAEYRDNGYVRYDVVALMSRFLSRPFTWQEVSQAGASQNSKPGSARE